MATSGQLSSGSDCDDLACPSGYRGNENGAPFNAGCVECVSEECQPYIARSECGEGCEKNWTDVWEGGDGIDGGGEGEDEGGEGEGDGEGGQAGAGDPNAVDSNSSSGSIIIGVGAGLAVGSAAILGFVVVKRRRRAGQVERIKALMSDDGADNGDLNMGDITGGRVDV